MEIKHQINPTFKIAGYNWLQLFRNCQSDLSVRTAEGVSVTCSRQFFRETVKIYFNPLETTDRKIPLSPFFDKPGNIFTIDDSDLQLNNKPGKVIVAKGSQAVTFITSGERGETISVIPCRNDEGMFLAPYCIFKSKESKDENSSGMPPGSEVCIFQKSAFVNTEIFFN